MIYTALSPLSPQNKRPYTQSRINNRIDLYTYYTVLYIHMPQVTVYVRDEDLPKWKAIDKKAEWLHGRLAETLTIDNSVAVIQIASGSVSNYNGISRPMSEAETNKFIPKPPDPDTGYPCCLKRAPCKHWYFDGVSGLWTNELTGKTREVT